MKLKYHDTLRELQDLLEKAAATKGISHIEVTPIELKAVMSHAHFAQVFPAFHAKRETQLQQYRDRAAKANRKLAGNMLSDTERQQQFDVAYNAEVAERTCLAEVPNELVAFNGITVRKSLQA